ncbi:MAG: hypothetical protein Terrestrivirus5_116 [Terrestrivirus sp.]|uniref:Sodium/calcium exchanger membrane region domain-containing protein n=1 Tax=Terrestrivirus sp. TaxID=2487775 RepID=A0A3G4ZPM1_9VIRU|nr:MAG: hypothetical protein Terrestrivirus5_116 [Terrestrivirus sp.]
MGIISEKISQYAANSLIVITWIASLIAIVMHFAGDVQPTVQFVLALIGMINMARMVGDATEALSEKMGDMIGGMMSAACGNIPELIFSLIALFNGSYSLLLATLMGSVVSNLLLVFGTSIMVGSYKNNWRQSYKKGPIHDLAMLLLFGTAMMFTATSYISGKTGNSNIITITFCVLLLVMNIIFTLYQLKFDTINLTSLRQHSNKRLVNPGSIPLTDVSSARSSNDGQHHENNNIAGGHGAEEITIIVEDTDRREDHHVTNEIVTPTFTPINIFGHQVTLPFSDSKKDVIIEIALLAIASAFVALLSEILTETCEVFSKELGLSNEFIGFFIVAFTGNAAEHWTGIKTAYNNEIDLSITTVETSGTQISMLIIPIIVLLSYTQSTPLYMVFDVYQLGIYISTILFVQYIIRDNESNFIEGTFLLMFYLCSAVMYGVVTA